MQLLVHPMEIPPWPGRHASAEGREVGSPDAGLPSWALHLILEERELGGDSQTVRLKHLCAHGFPSFCVLG